MRFTRLRTAIESGTLIDTHGKHFQGSAEKQAKASKKRKKPTSEERDIHSDDEDDEEGLPVKPKKRATSGPCSEIKMTDCNNSQPVESGAGSTCTIRAGLADGKTLPKKLPCSGKAVSSDTPSNEVAINGAPPACPLANVDDGGTTMPTNKVDVPVESTPTVLVDAQERRDAVVDPVRQLLAPLQPDPVSNTQ